MTNATKNIAICYEHVNVGKKTKQISKEKLMKLIMLANMNVKLFSCTFRKVTHQQIWGEVLFLTQASAIDQFWT